MAQPLPEPVEETTESNVRPLHRTARTSRTSSASTSSTPGTARAPRSRTPRTAAEDEPAPRARGTRPSRAKAAQADTEPDPLDIAREVVRLASDKGAADIMLMDIRKMSIIADYFVICTGDNERQIRAIDRAIDEGITEAFGVNPLNNRPGVAQEQGGWVIMDYGSVIVHIFSPQMREFYRLERLWSEAATLLRMQ